MPHLSIKIHRCNEVESASNDIFERELIFEKCIILEQGMTSGEPSIAFTLLDLATGKRFAAQTSAAILESLTHALKGARVHWAENPVENIWKK